MLGGRALADNLERRRGELMPVGILDQHAAGDRLHHPLVGAGSDLEEAEVLAFGETRAGRVVERLRDDALDEERGAVVAKAGDGFGGSAVHGTIQRDDAAEGGDGITFEGAEESLGKITANGAAARVGVLDDGAKGLIPRERVRASAGNRGVEFGGEVPGSLQVNDVVIRKLFALK